MNEKLNELISNDELLLHKIGLVLGSIVGILIGTIISKRADDFEMISTHEIIEPEEPTDGPEKD